MRPLTVILALALTLVAIAVGGCGSSTKTIAQTGANGEVTTQTVPNVHFAKTKFVAHMALAVGAFHHYVYKPLTGGELAAGAPGRVKTVLKAGVATLFAVHELKAANAAALSDARLRPLAERIDALLGRLTKLGGSLNPAAILGSAGAISALTAASGGLGVNIKEVVPSL
jgi:hypothetical protein